MPNHSSPDALSRLTEIMLAEPAHSPAPAAPPEHSRRRRRNRRRGALIAGVVVLALAGSAGGYAAWALNAPIGPARVEASAPTLPDIPEAVIPELSSGVASALSVTGADAYLGSEASGIWRTTGSNDPYPMASITKLVSALVVLDAKPLASADDPGPSITFSRADHALYDKYYVLGASIAEMPTGATMSLHEALEAMLIVSACNYAEAVTSWAFGSQSGFLRAARGWLTEHGLTSTTIVEPTGLDPRNTSSPSDLITLGKLALANPAVAQIVRMTSLQIPHVPVMSATNGLLGVDGVSGIKTGTLEESGANLLFSASVDVGLAEPFQVVGVVLGSLGNDTINRDVRALLASFPEGFRDVSLGVRGDRIGTYTTPWGESAEVVLGDSASVRVWSSPPISSSFRVDTLTTVARGDIVGELTWVVDGERLTVPLVVAGDIDPPDEWWRLTHPGELGG